MKKFIVFGLFALCMVNKVSSGCVDDQTCIKQQLTDIIEKFDQEERIPLFGGLEIVKTVENEPVNLDNRSKVGIVERIRRYVATHEIVVNENQSRGFDAEARMRRLKKLMLPLLLALKLKMAVVLPILITALIFVAAKGVMAGLFAIMLSGFTALKSLGEQKQDRVTTILAAPLHGMVHAHDYRWGRQDLVQDPSVIPSEAYNLPYVEYQNLNLPQKVAHH